MAKNRNRKQGGEQDRSPQTERAQEQSPAPAQQSPVSQIQGSPADVARKHQKRFGHN
ncbi:hypothetical protein [Streptomyces beigongshangae]|uniref:hypothetical protein n=1 Tax=Streptomyces beigongshangae TaxID=2841597 RepID=UPI001C85BBEA|nr:hypothetical protein [Streptomyces sp. REN17]